jgi:hypothetical protein
MIATRDLKECVLTSSSHCVWKTPGVNPGIAQDTPGGSVQLQKKTSARVCEATLALTVAVKLHMLRSK